MIESRIYLDHNATTPLDPRVFAAMEPFFLEEFGNAASRHHEFGRRAAGAVEAAREDVAGALAADPREIYWTSGATEANNLALFGCARSRAYAGRRHIVTVRTEHPAVLDPCRQLQADGFEVTFLPVDDQGRVDLDQLDAAIRADTLLVSAMHANNETGVLHPIREIGARCRAKGVLFHCDAVQSFGKLSLDVHRDHIDLLSLSAHKIYGPKGAGALFVRRKGPRVRCEPQILGGGHEKGMRSGTLNVPGIVGLGCAAALCVADRDGEHQRLCDLRDRLEAGLREALPGVRVHGAEAPRLPGTSNVSLGGIDAEALMAAVPSLAVSTASACTSAARQPSYVLGALGLDEAMIRSSLRFSLGRATTAADVDEALRRLTAAASALAAGTSPPL